MMQTINEKVLLVEGAYYYFAKGNTIYKTELNNKAVEKIGRFPVSFFDKLLLQNQLLQRVSRRGVHLLRRLPNGNLIGIIRQAIILKKKGTSDFESVFNITRGSRPLALEVDPQSEHIFFGEYFRNPKRETVHIYGSKNGVDWKIYYTFPAGRIRHVHRIVYDTYRQGMWVLTGDTDAESGLWFSADNFKTLELVVGGSQKARAVSIIPTAEGLIVPMDSPDQENFIHFFDWNTKKFEVLYKLPGPAFYAQYFPAIKRYFVTTVIEPSKIDISEYPTILTSQNGRDWEELTTFSKDLLSSISFHLFRYPEISICPSKHSSLSFFYCRGIKKYNGKTIIFPLNP